MVIDAIIFYGDCDQLEIRLAEHNSFVDRFVICENLNDFTHKKKPQQYDAERFKKYADKITYYTVEQWPEGCETLEHISGFWRDELHYGIKQQHPQPDDVVICTDLDEIISRDKWHYTPNMGLCAVEYRASYYFVNLISGTWVNGFVCPFSFLMGKHINDLRYNWHHCRRKYDTWLLRNYGWHFSWLGGAEVIKDKYRNFGRYEGWDARLADDAYVQSLLNDGIRFDNGQRLTKIDIDESFPDEIRLNQNKYKHFIK